MRGKTRLPLLISTVPWIVNNNFYSETIYISEMELLIQLMLSGILPIINLKVDIPFFLQVPICY